MFNGKGKCSYRIKRPNNAVPDTKDGCVCVCVCVWWGEGEGGIFARII